STSARDEKIVRGTQPNHGTPGEKQGRAAGVLQEPRRARVSRRADLSRAIRRAQIRLLENDESPGGAAGKAGAPGCHHFARGAAEVSLQGRVGAVSVWDRRRRKRR